MFTTIDRFLCPCRPRRQNPVEVKGTEILSNPFLSKYMDDTVEHATVEHFKLDTVLEVISLNLKRLAFSDLIHIIITFQRAKVLHER